MNALLAGGLILAAQLAPLDALRPDTVLEPEGGPRVLLTRTPDAGTVALRLSIPLGESAAEAGAARVLLRHNLGRLRRMVQQMGARMEGSRTPWGLAYTVTGAATDFDHLAWVLREAVSEPEPSDVSFQRARSAVLDEVERSLETAPGLLAVRLREAVAPTLPPLGGTRGSLNALSPADLPALWRRTHQRSGMTLTVAGDVDPAQVLAAARDVPGAPEDAAAGPADAPAPGAGRRPPVQVLRSWYGEAREAGPVDDPHAAVVAQLVGRRLAELGGRREGRVELWDVGERKVLAVTAAAYPAERQGLRQRLDGLLGEVAASLDEEQVERAAGTVLLDLLEAARSPAGWVGVVGWYHDATGTTEGAARYLTALEAVDGTSAGSYLATLQATSPARAQVTP